MGVTTQVDVDLEAEDLVQVMNEDAVFCNNMFWEIAHGLRQGLLLDNALDVLNNPEGSTSEARKLLAETFRDLASRIEYDEPDKHPLAAEYFLEDLKKTSALWVHCKTNGLYLLEDHCVIEGTEEDAVVYRCLWTNKLWVRPAAEFYDGRFGRVDMEVLGGFAQSAVTAKNLQPGSK